MVKVLQRGYPTDSLVAKLLEVFPEIAPDETIEYGRISDAIGVEPGTSRFRTVTLAWRKAVARTKNYVLQAVPARGFRRLPEIERSEKDRSGWRRDQSRAARKVRDLGLTDTTGFSDRDLKTHDHARRVLQAHVEHTSTTVLELTPPAALKLLPKRKG